MAIDWTFISDLEGGQRLDGYVPDARNSKSGVTIATGVDIGQRSTPEIDALPVPNTLKEKLRPYAGVTTDEAVAFLALRPLTITREEADQLDRAVKERSVAGIKVRYDRAVAGKPDARTFDDLSDAAQTVLCSVSFQYGVNLDRATPRFWRACTEQRWDDAVAELRSFGDKYPTRRNKEADRLSGAPEIRKA